IHRDIIMPPDLYKQYFPEGKTGPVATIGNLYFEPAHKVPPLKPEQLNLSTFTAYKYYEEEIRTITVIIKRLFLTQRVWTYNDLWKTVRAPPIGIEVNPKLFNEHNFIIALHNLVIATTPIIYTTKQSIMTETRLVEKLFDYSE